MVGICHDHQPLQINLTLFFNFSCLFAEHFKFLSPWITVIVNHLRQNMAPFLIFPWFVYLHWGAPQHIFVRAVRKGVHRGGNTRATEPHGMNNQVRNVSHTYDSDIWLWVIFCLRVNVGNIWDSRSLWSEPHVRRNVSGSGCFSIKNLSHHMWISMDIIHGNENRCSLKIYKCSKVYVEIFLGQHSFLEAPSYRIPKNG